MRNFDREIAMYIRAAQISSDRAKASDVSSSESEAFYKIKDACIQRAINLICQSKSRTFRFSVTATEVEHYWQPCCIIYFSYKAEKQYQVSFHSFNLKIKGISKSTKKSNWDRKCSREASMIISDDFNIENSARRVVFGG